MNSDEIKININNDTLRQIVDAAKKYHGSEFEFRLGFQEGYFNTDIKQNAFDRIMDFFSSDPNYQRVEENTLSSIHKDDLRVISDGDRQLAQIKKRLTDIDIGRYNGFDIRLSVSSETKVDDSPPMENAIITRDKARTTFTHVDGLYQVDLSVVTTREPGKPPVVSYEAELEFINLPPLPTTKAMPMQFVKALFKPLKTLIYSINPNQIYISDDRSGQVVAALRKRLGIKKTDMIISALQRPTDLTVKQVSSIINHAVTVKYDGVRAILITMNDNSTPELYAVVNDKASLLPFTMDTDLIVDCELMDGVYYIFDVLFAKGTDFRKKDLRTRLSAIEGLEMPEQVLPKPIFMDGDIKKRISDALEASDASDNDGLIMIPMTEQYLNPNVFKIKPVEKLSIDFTLVPYGVDPDLHAYTPMSYSKGSLVQFTGAKKAPYRQQQIMLTDAEYNEIFPKGFKKGSVVEFTWRSDNFRPMRARPDRTNPNGIRTALNVWHQFLNPLSIKQVISRLPSSRGDDDLKTMRSSHNSMKNSLIKRFASKSNVLDLGAGRGGDLHKYTKENVSKLLMIEPDSENLAELHRRLSKHDRKFERRVKTIQSVAENTDLITEEVMKMFGQKADTVTSFFMLTHLFGLSDSVKQFVKTVIATTKEGGHLIGTVMESSAVQDAFNETSGNTLTGKGWRIERKYKKAAPYGSKIIIDLEGTMVQAQVEYLASIDVLETLLIPFGFRLIENRPIPGDGLVGDAARLNSLFRYFVFKLDKAPDANVLAELLSEVGIKPDEPAPAKMSLRNTKGVKVDKLPVDERGIFKCPISTHLGLKFVRIGIVDEEDSFYHAILNSMTPSYRKLTEEDRIKTVLTLRREIMESVTIDQWKNLDSGRVAYIPLLTGLREAFVYTAENRVKFITEDVMERLISGYPHNNRDINKYTLYLIDEYQKILIAGVDAASKKNLKLSKETLMKTTVPKLMRTFATTVGEVTTKVYRKFLPTINRYARIDGAMIELVRNAINKDIYIIDAKSGRVPTSINYTQLPPRNSVILVRINDRHYESIGIVTTMSNGKKGLRRYFSPSHPLIDFLFKMVKEPLRYGKFVDDGYVLNTVTQAIDDIPDMLEADKRSDMREFNAAINVVAKEDEKGVEVSIEEEKKEPLIPAVNPEVAPYVEEKDEPNRVLPSIEDEDEDEILIRGYMKDGLSREEAIDAIEYMKEEGEEGEEGESEDDEEYEAAIQDVINEMNAE